LEINAQTAGKLCAAGRARWKIENEGFNAQKNGGYELAHKYSRTSFAAAQNYCLCLQTARLINRFAERSATVAKLVKNKFTLRHIWEKILRPALALRFSTGQKCRLCKTEPRKYGCTLEPHERGLPKAAENLCSPIQIHPNFLTL